MIDDAEFWSGPRPHYGDPAWTAYIEARRAATIRALPLRRRIGRHFWIYAPLYWFVAVLAAVIVVLLWVAL